MRIWLGNASNVLETIVEEVPTKNSEPTMDFVAIQVAVQLSFSLASMSRLVTFPSDAFLLASISLFYYFLSSIEFTLNRRKKFSMRRKGFKHFYVKEIKLSCEIGTIANLVIICLQHRAWISTKRMLMIRNSFLFSLVRQIWFGMVFSNNSAIWLWL